MCRRATLPVSGEYILFSLRHFVFSFWQRALSSDFNRLILYFPVSALVTLFGNILQNPQDPRARSDVRLMNLVVNFLSMLATDEENGGVKRMLSVCSEFERIAKVVLDKSEKETSSRRKRKTDEGAVSKNPAGNPASIPTPQTPLSNGVGNGHTSVTNTPSMPFMSPPNRHASNPNTASISSFSPMPPSQTSTPAASHNWNEPPTSEFVPPDSNEMITNPFSEVQGFTNGNEMNSPLNPNNFQQPIIPQDLWQMPMTLEWDWADMQWGNTNGLGGGPSAGGYPGFDGSGLGDMDHHMR